MLILFNYSFTIAELELQEQSKNLNQFNDVLEFTLEVALQIENAMAESDATSDSDQTLKPKPKIDLQTLIFSSLTIVPSYKLNRLPDNPSKPLEIALPIFVPPPLA